MGEARRILLTVSGVIPPDLDEQIATDTRPRADYRVLCDRLGADVVDVTAARIASGRVGRIVESIGGAGALLGWHAFRRRSEFDVLISDGEQVGLPFALLCRLLGRRSVRHVMIVHVLSTTTKSWLIRVGRLAPLIDRFVVYSTSQRDYIESRLGVGRDRLYLTPFMVDTAFFDPARTGVESRALICSAGLERRDYATFIAAVEGLDVDVVIAAASPWSRRRDSSRGLDLPENVRIERLDLAQLRDLYAMSSVVVMPLEDVDFQAGVTTILEAMSMSKPVVCTRTAGQTDTIIDGHNGVYVPPADPARLRATLNRLLGAEDEAAALGSAARSWAVRHADIDRYADRVAEVVRSLDVAPS